MIDLIVFGLMWGISISFTALALGTTWRILGILDFGLAGVYAVAAFALYTLHVELGLTLWLALPLAVAVGPGLQLAIYAGIYRPFLNKRKPLATLVLLSLAVLYICENLLSLGFTSAGRMVVTSPPLFIDLAGLSLTLLDLVSALVLAVVVLALWLMFRRTGLGLALRASATNPELAQLFGVSPERVRVAVFGLAGGLTALASVLVALYQPITPSAGFNPLLFAFAALVIASAGSGVGLLAHVVAGIGLGVLTGLSLVVIPSQWQLAVPFGAMLIFTMVRRSTRRQRAV